MDYLLTTAEVAEMTRLPAGTLRYYRHQNSGPPSFRLGRKTVYRRELVEAWIAQHEAADPRNTAA